MTLRPEFTLGHSPYNAFLFAEVGEEQVGGPLTVLTALTRLGLDPWQEAARLSDLPRDVAAHALAARIALLPEGNWKATDAEAIASRLVSSLPEHSAEPIPPVIPPPSGDRKKMKPELARALAWGVLAAALLFFAVNYFSNNNFESGQRSTETTQR
jgi:hypothetical protein